MKRYFIYILYSPSLDAYYKGFSTDVERRFIEHLTGFHKYTSQVRDWIIVYSKEMESKKEALIEEKRLKKLNRRSIEKLIDQ